MNWRNLTGLYFCGMSMIYLVTSFQGSPGYMDAEYYYSGGYRLASGFGFSDPFIWNYLDDPQGIPHPSHTYWMPLVSILSAIGMVICGKHDFVHARIVLVLLSASIPPFVALLSYALNKSKEAALFSGLLAIFPGFYLAYLGTTDAFGVYMLLGAIWLLCIRMHPVLEDNPLNLKFEIKRFFTLGILSGLMHLTRADGWMWLGVSFFMFGVIIREYSPLHRKWLSLPIALIIGYLVIMAPWMIRNQRVFGAPFSIVGSRILWAIDYDDVYIYPPELLTFNRWSGSGVKEIVSVRLWALGQNLQTALAVQNQIFLLPLVGIGIWRLREDLCIKSGLLAWLVSLFVMTVLFPFAGVRGGFFHSGAALQPLFWAVAPAGFEAILQWGVRVRNWNYRLARRIFSPGLLAIALIFTFVIGWQRVIGSDIASPVWDESYRYYTRMDKTLEELGIGADELIMVNNPPGFFTATHRSAIVIPDNELSTLLDVSRRYNAPYVLLDANHPIGLAELYDNPGKQTGLEYLKMVENARVYRVLDDIK